MMRIDLRIYLDIHNIVQERSKFTVAQKFKFILDDFPQKGIFLALHCENQYPIGMQDSLESIVRAMHFHIEESIKRM